MKLSAQQQTSFDGRTRIYAISDSHQETRKVGAFLSRILDKSKSDKNVLFLNGGDIFKGVYPGELERDAYIKMKEVKPDMEMVMTLGNNDFGFYKEHLDFLIETVKNFALKGIKVVCANIFKSDGNRPEWLKPYTTVTLDGDRTLVTGFCIDNISAAKFGILPKKQDEVLEEIMDAVRKEKPDNVIILNHDYMPVSRHLREKCAKEGINVDVIIGGHDHEIVPPDTEHHIYYPEAFGTSMYEFDLVNDNGKKQIENLQTTKNNPDMKIHSCFLSDLEKFEKESKLLDGIVPCTLHLPKVYSDACSLGSFLADNMKKYAGCDVGFFSTGFLMKPMEYKPDSFITLYKLKKTMTAENPVKKVELTAADLGEIFKHSMKGYGYGESNPKFLQCSNNMRLEGKNIPEEQRWELRQIYINDEPLFDSEMKPINPDKKYTCAIDWYISEGGQGFKTLQEAQKEEIYIDGELLKINDALLKGLIDAAKTYPKGMEYPHFEITKL